VFFKLLKHSGGKPKKGLVEFKNFFYGFFPPPPRNTTLRPLQYPYQGMPDYIHPGQE